VPSRFTTVRFESTYEYWAPTPRPPARRRRRPSRVGGTVLPRLEVRPRYYALSWQVLLWLACTVLIIMLAG